MIDSDALSLPVANELTAFRSLFKSSLQTSNVLLHQVVDHLLSRNGKMMRPLLTLLSAKLLGEVNQITLHAAVSLELLHTASLVHDDVVDDSNERRGQASVNASFNNKVAVLSGDYLLATSLIQVARTGLIDLVQLVGVLGQHLADGELLQLQNIDTETFSEEVYYHIITKKTAVLFATCAKAGAISAHAPADVADALYRFGELVGCCFQIRDDIFDYTGSAEIGKPVGNDMLEGKLTLPVIYALNRTNDPVYKALAHRVRSHSASDDEIGQLVRFAIEQGGIEYAESVMDTFSRQAIDLLAPFAQSPVYPALTDYVRFVVMRRH